MKKITNFIVEKRNIILIIFLILSGISLFMSQKVNINYDIAKYLPSTSETRIGMNIMESEFDEEKSSSLNLMFKDLKETEKEEILDNLENIKGVSEVDYDETEEYRSACCKAVKDLSIAVGIPADLKNIVKEKDLDFLANSALADACCPGNPKTPTKEEVIAIYKSLM